MTEVHNSCETRSSALGEPLIRWESIYFMAKEQTEQGKHAQALAAYEEIFNEALDECIWKWKSLKQLLRLMGKLTIESSLALHWVKALLNGINSHKLLVHRECIHTALRLFDHETYSKWNEQIQDQFFGELKASVPVTASAEFEVKRTVAMIKFLLSLKEEEEEEGRGGNRVLRLSYCLKTIDLEMSRFREFPLLHSEVLLLQMQIYAQLGCYWDTMSNIYRLGLRTSRSVLPTQMLQATMLYVECLFMSGNSPAEGLDLLEELLPAENTEGNTTSTSTTTTTTFYRRFIHLTRLAWNALQGEDILATGLCMDEDEPLIECFRKWRQRALTKEEASRRLEATCPAEFKRLFLALFTSYQIRCEAQEIRSQVKADAPLKLHPQHDVSFIAQLIRSGDVLGRLSRSVTGTGTGADAAVFIEPMISKDEAYYTEKEFRYLNME